MPTPQGIHHATQQCGWWSHDPPKNTEIIERKDEAPAFLYVDGTSQHDVIPGTGDFNVNRGVVDFEVVVTPEYSGVIATPSSPLTWGTAKKRVTFRGSGQLFMSNAFADVFVDSDNRQDAVTIDAYALLMAKHGGRLQRVEAVDEV